MRRRQDAGTLQEFGDVVTLPRTMKAAILVAQRRPLALDEVTLPDALGVGQVLVQVHYSGLCGSQLGEIDGVKGPDGFLPHLLGHEGSGTVLSIGPGVRQVRDGDRVVLHWRKGAGIEAEAPVYGWNGAQLHAGWVTTFNEYAVVSENRLTRIPDGFDLVLATLLGCAVTTGLGVVCRDARVTLGESVIVLGTGGVGLSVVQGAALVSAHPIVAVDQRPAKLELARKLGASHTIAVRETRLAEAARQIVGEAGADVVVECTGEAEMIRAAYALAGPRGRVILVGVPRTDTPVAIDTLPLHFGKVLTGSHGGAAQPEHDIPRYARLCAAGKLDLAPLITDRVHLADINAAIERLRRGVIAGRCVIEVKPP